MAKTSKTKEKDLERVRNLLILQLSYDGVFPVDIAKATGMSLTDIYKIIPKKSKKKSKQKSA